MEKKRRDRAKRAQLTPEHFKSWREKLRWTQVEAAAWFQVHPRTYQGWEEGRRQYHSDRMIRELMRKAKPKVSTVSDDPRML